jgi:DNA repair exonuclease SbcCD ATPase subunit
MLTSMTLPELEQTVKSLSERFQRESGQLELLKQQLQEKQAELQQVQTDIEIWKQVQILLGKVSEFAREQLKKQIEATVTAGLQAILQDDEIRFVIEMTTIGGKPAADWKIITTRGEQPITASPEDAHGGGIVDIVSLCLRAALLELSRPKPGGPFLLDEPGKMISAEYLPNVAEFLKQYLKKTGRQGIMITHHEPLAEVADVSYRVRQENGISEVERL